MSRGRKKKIGIYSTMTNVTERMVKESKDNQRSRRKKAPGPIGNLFLTSWRIVLK
jgi:hypothetical protein